MVLKQYSNLYSTMQMQTIRASEKGQLTIPRAMFDAIGHPRGLVLVPDGERLIVVPAGSEARRIAGDLAGWEGLSGPAFADVWDNEVEKAWNDA